MPMGEITEGVLLDPLTKKTEIQKSITVTVEV
jgi:hypothetical protein